MSMSRVLWKEFCFHKHPYLLPPLVSKLPWPGSPLTPSINLSSSLTRIETSRTIIAAMLENTVAGIMSCLRAHFF